MKNKEAVQILEKLSPGKRKYEEKKAIKNGFASLYDSIVWKLEEPIRARWERRDAIKLSQLNEELKKQKLIENEKEFWKKTNKDGTPFFNNKYYFNYKPKTEKGTPIQPSGTSKEMLEWFLKSIGHLNPNEIPQGVSAGNDDEVTLNYIETCLFFLFTLYEWNVFSQRMQTNNTTEVSLKIFEWFSELEHHITDNKMFWCIFEWIFTVQSKYFTDETFNRYGRIDVPFKERLQLSELLNSSRNDNSFSKHFIDKSSKYPKTDYWIKTLINPIEDDEYLTVYRSFKVPKGEPIRKGITLDNQDSFIHQAGNGFSYSLSKFVAIRLSWFINSFIIKKYSKVDDKEAERILNSKWLDKGQMQNPTFFDGFYSCIGEFKIKKNKILFATGMMAEEEIIANPKDVILEDYRFINVVDTFAFQSGLKFVDNWINHATNVWKFSITDITQIINLDGIFDYFYVHSKKYCKENPNMVGRILRDGHTLLFNELIPYTLNALDIQIIKEYGWDKEHKVDMTVAPISINNRHMFEVSADGFIFPLLNGDSVRQKSSISKKHFFQRGFIHDDEVREKRDNHFKKLKQPQVNPLIAESIKKFSKTN